MCSRRASFEYRRKLYAELQRAARHGAPGQRHRERVIDPSARPSRQACTIIATFQMTGAE